MIQIPKDSTSQSLNIYCWDPTTNGPKTGLLYTTITANYVRPGAAYTAITPLTQTPTGAYSSGGFCEISATYAPGWYRLDIPNAALATGVEEVTLVILSGTDVVGQETIDLFYKISDIQSGLATATNVSDVQTHIDINLDAKVSTRAAPGDILEFTANKLTTGSAGGVFVDAMGSNVITSAQLYSTAITAIQANLATATNVTNAVTAIETFGGAAPWTTATGFATPTNVTDAVTAIKSGTTPTLAEIKAKTDTIVTSGWSTPTNVTDAVTAVNSHTDTNLDAKITSRASATDMATVLSDLTTLLADVGALDTATITASLTQIIKKLDAQINS